MPFFSKKNKDIHSKVKKILLTGATIATLASPVSGAKNNSLAPASEAIKKENVINPSRHSWLNKFDTLEKILSDYSSIDHNDLGEISDWKHYITDNPQDTLAEEAFKAIKRSALELTNTYVQVDHYYETGYLHIANISYQQLKSCQNFFQTTMDELLQNPEVLRHIPDAYVINKDPRLPAKDFATLRLYEQMKIHNRLRKNMNQLNEYFSMVRSNNKKKQLKANIMRMNFYKAYGVDFNECYLNDTDNMAREHVFLDKKIKEKVYMYCLHTALDGAFDYKPGYIEMFKDSYKGLKYNISPKVVQNFIGYANIFAKHMHGKKLSKAEKNILDNTPSDIRTATNAYCQRYCEQYCTLMDKPEGEDIIAINTNSQTHLQWTEYIKLQRLKEKTHKGSLRISELQRDYPLFVKATEYYEYKKEASQNKKQQATYLIQNVATR